MKILKNIILILLLLSLSSCSLLNNGNSESDDEKSETDNGEKPGSDFKMTAEITELGDKISVNVTDSEYASGIYWVITASATEYFDKNGDKIKRSDLKIGDTVEILYSGQVMMSYPPQIVAARITVL